MISAELIEHFHLLGDAPETMQQLRKIIVALAIRGKLANEGKLAIDASSLRDEIQKRRHALTVSGELRKREQPEVMAEDLPADFLDTTRFVRLGFVANVEKGVTGIQSAKQGPYPLVVTAADRATCDHFDFEGAAAIVPLVSSAGHGKASLNRLHYQEGKFALGSILAAVFPLAPDLISARFLFEYLTAFKEELLVSRMSGTANVTLTVGRICDVPVPLIAPATQKRIDELMALCDQLEVARNEREVRRDRLVAASLHRIGTAPTALEEGETGAPSATRLRDAARFHLNHLPRLTTRPEHIKLLRQTILNLAVRGHLVFQDPNDEPAVKLLERIKMYRDQILNAGYPNTSEARSQLKKQLTQVVPDGLKRLPRGWQWATLMQCSALIVDCHNKTAPYSQAGVPLIRTTNVRDGKLNLNEPKFVDEPTYARWSVRCEPEPGDILITREAPMGEVAVIPDGMKICLGQRMMLVRLIEKTIDPRYMLYSLRDPLLMDRVQDKPVGATVQHLRVGGVETLLVPLPPLAEQHRIVAKVDELMALCDQLETQLTTTQTDSRRLLEAVLHEALAA